MERAKGHHELLGVDLAAYPKDFRIFFRYHRALKRIAALSTRPAPLDLADLDAFLGSARPSSAVEIVPEPA